MLTPRAMTIALHDPGPRLRRPSPTIDIKELQRRAFERGTGNMHMLVSRDPSPLVAVLNGIFYANPPRRPVSWSTYQRISDTLPLEWAVAPGRSDV